MAIQWDLPRPEPFADLVLQAGAEPYMHIQTGKPLVDWFTKDEYERYLDEVARGSAQPEEAGCQPTTSTPGNRRLDNKCNMRKERWRGPQPFTFEEVTRIAREVAVESGGHVPVLIAEGSRGSFGGRVANLPNTHEDCEFVGCSLLAMLSAQSAEVGELQKVIFISEGWMKGGRLNHDHRKTLLAKKCFSCLN